MKEDAEGHTATQGQGSDTVSSSCLLVTSTALSLYTITDSAGHEFQMESHHTLVLEGAESLGSLGTLTGQVQKHLGALCPLASELGLGGKREEKDDPVTEFFHQRNNSGHQLSHVEHLVGGKRGLPTGRKLTLPKDTTSSGQS